MTAPTDVPAALPQVPPTGAPSGDTDVDAADDVPLTLRSDACKVKSGKYPRGRTGTPNGYRRHQEANEPPCDLCRAAETQYRQDLRAGRKPVPSVSQEWDGPTCARPSTDNQDGVTGTPAGYQRHIKADEPACPECLQASRDYNRERYWRDPEQSRRFYRVQYRYYRNQREQQATGDEQPAENGGHR